MFAGAEAAPGAGPLEPLRGRFSWSSLMRITARKSSKITGRERLMSERTRSAPLRDVFPNVDQLRIELVFNDASAFIPSPQLHTLYPAASAFFRFACPCADCDGDFDLSGRCRLAPRDFSGTTADRCIEQRPDGVSGRSIARHGGPESLPHATQFSPCLGRRASAKRRGHECLTCAQGDGMGNYEFTHRAAHSPPEHRARRDHAQPRDRAPARLARGRPAARCRGRRDQRHLP